MILGHYSCPEPGSLGEPFSTLWTRAERNGPTAAISHAKGCRLLKSIASVPRGLVWLLKAGAALTFQRTETLHP